MYTIGYDPIYRKFIVDFKDIDFDEALIQLRDLKIYWDAKLRKNSFPLNKAMDIFALFNYYEIEHSITTEALNKFKDIFESFKPEQEYYRKVSLDESILQDHIKLFDYQKEGVNFFLSRKRAYCADDAGLGKTLQAIFTFSQLYKENKVDKIFIINRPGISYHWKNEILDSVDIFKEEDILLVDNKNKKLLFDTHPDYKIYIIPNHLLKAVFLSYKKDTDINKSAKRIKWKSYVDINKKLNSDKLCIVIDEAHELTNSSGVNTQALLSHIDYFKYRYCLSATPTGNRWEKYWNAMALIDKGALRMSEIAFKTYIAKPNCMGNRFDPYVILNYDEKKVEDVKNKVLNLYFIKRLKKDLPEMKYKQIIKPIYFEISSLHRKLYRDFIQEEVNKIEQLNENITLKLILQKYPYLSQVTDCPLLLEGKVQNPIIENIIKNWTMEKDERYTLLKQLLKSYVEEDGEKVVVFDGHPKTIDVLAKKFEKYNPIIMHGGTGDDEKSKKYKQDLFNNKNNEHRILIANPAVAGIGLNLNKGGRRIIFYTQPFDAVLMEQSMGRTYRINNTEDAIIDILIADNTLDVLKHKRNSGRLKLNQDFLTKQLNRSELKMLLEMSNRGGMY